MCGLKRIFCDTDLVGVIELTEDQARYIKTVLRLNSNDKVEVLSRNKLAVGTIMMAGKKGVTLRIDEYRDVKHPDYVFHVYQCIAKREYMDNIIEKYAELGVTRVIPVISTRGLQELKSSTMQRFNSIAIAATLQSENEHVMEITEAISINNIISETETNLIFHERFGQKMMPTELNKSVSIIIGAEGGFTDSESEALVNKGFVPIHPIDVILKAETAAILFSGLIRINL